MIDPRDSESASSVVLIVAFFVIIHGVLFAWIVPAEAWRGGGDVATYLDPAIGLFRHGAFVEPEAPQTPSLYRLPLYTAFVAGTFFLADGENPRLALLGNLAMLLGTGVLMRRVAATWIPGRASLVFALTLFNPLAIGTAYILQPLNLNALLYAMAGWLLLRKKEPPTVSDILATGLVVGLSALTRPAGQILIAALPIGVLVLAWLMGQKREFSRTLWASLAASVIAFMITLPWMLYAQASGHGFRLSSVEHNTLFLRDNNSSLEFHLRGGSLQDAKDRLIAGIEEWKKIEGREFSSLAPADQSAAVNDYLIRHFAEYPVAIFVKAWTISVVNLFVSGGSTNLRMALGIEAPKAWEMIVLQPGYNYITAFFAALAESSAESIAVSVICVGFVVVCRLLGLVGIVTAARRGDWGVLATSLGLFAFFSVIHIFVGESAYRAPIEPYLIVLAAYGYDGLARLFTARASRPA